MRVDIGGIVFHVPPECQGQIVEISFGADEEGIFRRTVDHSRGSGDPERVVVELADWDDVWGEWEPWIEAPDVEEDAWERVEIG